MNPFWTNVVIDILLVIYVIDCAFMGLIIMMQRSKQEGLGAAFGGGITESVFGAQTSSVLVKGTVYAAVIFFIISISLARLYAHRNALSDEASAVQRALLAPTVAPAKPAPTPGTPTNAAGQPVVPTATPMTPATNAAAPAKPAPTPAPASPTPAKPAGSK